MIIWTTGGFYEITDAEDENVIVHAKTQEDFESLLDTLQLIDHDEDELTIIEQPHGYGLRISKDTLELWMTFEIRYYIDYTNFDVAVLQGQGYFRLSALERLHMNLESK